MSSDLKTPVPKGLCTTPPDGPFAALRVTPGCAAASGWPVEGGAGQALGFAVIAENNKRMLNGHVQPFQGLKTR